jgi:hypothetical protein
VHNRSREAARVFALLTLVPILAAAPRAGGQQVDRLMTRPDVRALLDTIKAGNAWTLQQQVALCEIPAPPFTVLGRGEGYKGGL